MQYRKTDVTYGGNLSRVKTFANFAVSGQLAKVLTMKIFIEYGGVIINGRAIFLDNDLNDDSEGIMDVASLSLAKQYLSKNSFPNRHVDMVASINSHHCTS